MIVQSQTTASKPSDDAPDRVGVQLSVFPLPLTPLEQFLIQCDTPRSPMIMRVVLRFTGDCCAQVLVDTFQRAISRHPLASCRIARRKGRLEWIAGTAASVVSRRITGRVFEPHSIPVSERIDLTTKAGVQSEILMLDDGVKVVMNTHHAVADGNGLRQIITDWLHLYHCEITGERLRLPVVDLDRLQQRHQFPQPPSVAPIGLREAIRNLLVTIRGRTARLNRTKAIRLNDAETWHSHCVEKIVSPEQFEQIERRLIAWKVTLNDLMIASSMSIFSQMAPAGKMNHQVTVLNPTDLRLPSDRSLPAANRFGFAFIRRARSGCHDPAGLLRGIHDEMDYVKSNYIGAEFIKGLEVASKIPGGVDALRKLGLFIPSLQWTCLGDVTRGAKRLMPWKDRILQSGGLRLETATAFAPFAENVPLSIATCEAGKQITLTVRSSQEYLSMEQTEDFATSLLNLACRFELPATTDEKKYTEVE